jgi:hypothetical protein
MTELVIYALRADLVSLRVRFKAKKKATESNCLGLNLNSVHASYITLSRDEDVTALPRIHRE